MSMYRFSSRNRSFATPFCVFIVLASLVGPPSHATFDHDLTACLDATPVDLNATTRTTSLESSYHFIRVELPSAGLLSVSASAANLAELTLDMEPTGCDAVAVPVVIKRSTSHMVVSVLHAGSYIFIVGSDPLVPVFDNVIRAAFIPFSSQSGETDVGEDGNEIEVEPDPGRNSDGSFGLGRRLPFPLDADNDTSDVGEDGNEIEVEPDPGRNSDGSFGLGWSLTVPLDADNDPSDVGEDGNEIEVEPDPGRGWLPPAETLSAKLQRLCRRLASDDHGNVPTCATFLSGSGVAIGELSNGWGDDEDMFEFLVGSGPGPGRSSIAITLHSEIDVVAGLYDRAGQRIDWVALGDREVRFRRALEAGTYFLRLASSDGQEGSYAVSISGR